MNIKRIIKIVKQKVLETFFRKPQLINLNKPIISFTFDDVPPSAVTNGGRLLNEFGFKGTYYVASGIAENESSYLTVENLRQLKNDNHEIACHTFNHVSLRWASSNKTMQQSIKNINAIHNSLPEYPVINFSYPFGEAGILSKRVLRKQFDSMRTSDYGLNYGMTDMSHLRAVSLYSKDFNQETLLDIIKKTVENKAWTIFYTHDVADNFGPWGTSIDDFKWILEQCNNNEIDVLNIRDAIDVIKRDAKS
jgi:peptidoglycan/xylan/chitin deacetylase (PgdA/CDA1 family)